MPDFIIRRMNPAALSAAYQAQIPRHFPASEVRPFDPARQMPGGEVPMLDVQTLLRENRYAAFGAYDTDALAAYAFLCWDEHGTALLDYLAVMEDYRCHGVGSLMMNYLLSGSTALPWKCLILEVDDPDFAGDEAELTIRLRRNAFYHRAGLRESRVRVQLFGARYRIFTDAHGLSDEALLARVRAMYPQLVPSEKLTRESWQTEIQ